MRIYVIDISSSDKKTGESIAESIITHLRDFKKKQPKFDFASVRYFLTDHCSNNTGELKGAIVYLEKVFPNIKFIGCKDHLLNLFVQSLDRIASEIIGIASDSLDCNSDRVNTISAVLLTLGDCGLGE